MAVAGRREEWPIPGSAGHRQHRLGIPGDLDDVEDLALALIRKRFMPSLRR
jgi:hypothetical protein